MATPTLPVQFTAHDRCDQCGAQAKAVATYTRKASLLFCGHHGREHAEALTDQGWNLTWEDVPHNAAATADSAPRA